MDWPSYVAGFFDGEGSICIARLRNNGMSDYHCIKVAIGQRSKYRSILDRIQAEYGGTVGLRRQVTRVSENWAEHATWQLQDKRSIRVFLLAMQPICIVKKEQIRIGLEFLDSFQKGSRMRDDLGRIRGMTLTADEIERRERLRLELRAVNEVGPPRVRPSSLPPLDVQHRRRLEGDLVGNRNTISHGEGRPLARLTDEVVRAVRKEYAVNRTTLEELAARHGVSLMTISRAIHGETWKHVT